MSMFKTGGHFWSPRLVGWGQTKGPKTTKELLGYNPQKGTRGRPKAAERTAKVVNLWNMSGIYALYKGDRLVYIGKASESIGDRLREHMRDDDLAGRWDSFSWLSPQKVDFPVLAAPAATQTPPGPAPSGAVGAAQPAPVVPAVPAPATTQPAPAAAAAAAAVSATTAPTASVVSIDPVSTIEASSLGEFLAEMEAAMILLGSPVENRKQEDIKDLIWLEQERSDHSDVDMEDMIRAIAMKLQVDL